MGCAYPGELAGGQGSGRTHTVDAAGKVVALVWFDPRPGQAMEVPLPGLAGRRLAVGFAGWA